jgi:hypothetical protein
MRSEMEVVDLRRGKRGRSEKDLNGRVASDIQPRALGEVLDRGGGWDTNENDQG